MQQQIGVGLLVVTLLSGTALAQESRPTVNAVSQVNTLVLHVEGMS